VYVDPFNWNKNFITPRREEEKTVIGHKDISSWSVVTILEHWISSGNDHCPVILLVSVILFEQEGLSFRQHFSHMIEIYPY
jgi:hypothetical protein